MLRFFRSTLLLFPPCASLAATMSLTKDLTNLTYGIGFLWLLLLLQTAFLLVRRQWLYALLPAAIAAFVWLVGATLLPYNLLAALELPYARASLDDVPEADAVVMLGGAHERSQYDAFGVGAISAFDRAIMALELMRRKRAPALVLGGGGFLEAGKPTSEAVVLERWFAAWQLPAAPVFNLGINGNTHDEALSLRTLAAEKKWTRIILVTSANHMKRSAATFRATGLEVIPVACDFQSIGGVAANKAQGYVPTGDGFRVLDAYLHETVGWLFYRLRGWFDAMGPIPPPNPAPTPADTNRPATSVEAPAPPSTSKPAAAPEPPGLTNALPLPRSVSP